MDREDFENLFKKIKSIAGGGSQKEVAEKLGISPQAISDAKRGSSHETVHENNLTN